MATIAIIALFAFSAALTILTPVEASSSGTLTKAGSGLVHQDSLTKGVPSCTGGYNDSSSIDTSYWTIYGSAENEPPSTWTACEGPSGLYLGVDPMGPNGEWAGIYAESATETVMLYHAFLTLPSYSISTIKSGDFNTGLYVQTYNGLINYVTCAAQVQQGGGYYWGVTLATGNTNQVTQYTQLWTGPTYTNMGPTSEDCTIVTNGSSLLQVYLNGTLVYSNTHDNLNMPEPFNAYLEVESSDTGQMLWASYRDYYSTTSNVVTIQNVPAGDVAELVSGSTVLASAMNGGSSPASVALNVASYDLPLSASLEVLSGGTVVATTGSTSFWSGDTYAYSPGTGTSSTTSSTSSGTTTTTTTAGQGIAITSTASTSGAASLPSYQITLSNFAAGAGSDSLLVVGVSANNASVASVTFGGVALTNAVASYYNNDAEFWYLVAPSGTANIVVTMTGATQVVVGAYAFAGVDQTDPITSQASAYNTSPSSPSIGIAAKSANDLVLDLPSIYGGSTLASPTCSGHWDVNMPNKITGASSSATVSSPGTVNCGWTASTPDFWDDVAIEVAAASSGTTTTTTSTTSSATTSSATTTSTTSVCYPIIGCV